jgi:hypothetical protein
VIEPKRGIKRHNIYIYILKKIENGGIESPSSKHHCSIRVLVATSTIFSSDLET